MNKWVNKIDPWQQSAVPGGREGSDTQEVEVPVVTVYLGKNTKSKENGGETEVQRTEIDLFQETKIPEYTS